ncbi:MAG: TetR family transcriptional regulator [bacterium]|nr:TetR family transcriptional regulator [bacterium]
MANRQDDATAEKLLAAAEEAFAQSGIESASVRQINAAAGQRNTSAVRYHFGSKEGLLETLIERRMGALERERAAALLRLDEETTAPSVELLVEALVRPLAERVCREPSWGCWVRVLSQLVSIRGHSHHRVWQGEHDRTSQKIFLRLRRTLPDLSDAVWRQRATDLMTWITSSLCERARMLEAGMRPPLGREAFIENLILTSSRALAA